MEMLDARLAVYQVCQTRGSPEGRMGHIYVDLRAAHVLWGASGVLAKGRTAACLTCFDVYDFVTFCYRGSKEVAKYAKT